MMTQFIGKMIVLSLILGASVQAHEIDCALASGPVSNSSIELHQPIQIDVDETAYRNLSVVYKSRLRAAFDLKSVTFNVTGTLETFYPKSAQSSTNAATLFMRQNPDSDKRVIFLDQAVHGRKLKALVLATGLMGVDSVLQYNIECKY